jgi:hypothetical protein
MLRAQRGIEHDTIAHQQYRTALDQPIGTLAARSDPADWFDGSVKVWALKCAQAHKRFASSAWGQEQIPLNPPFSKGEDKRRESNIAASPQAVVPKRFPAHEASEGIAKDFLRGR